LVIEKLFETLFSRTVFRKAVLMINGIDNLVTCRQCFFHYRNLSKCGNLISYPILHLIQNKLCHSYPVLIRYYKVISNHGNKHQNSIWNSNCRISPHCTQLLCINMKLTKLYLILY